MREYNKEILVLGLMAIVYLSHLQLQGGLADMAQLRWELDEAYDIIIERIGFKVALPHDEIR